MIEEIKMLVPSKKLFLSIIFICGLLLNIMGLHRNALADDPLATSVTISPNPASLNGCDSLALEIWVNNVNGLYGADIQLTFNPLVLEVQDDDPVKNGVQVQNGGFLAPDFVLYNSVDNLNGNIRYTITQLNPTEPVHGSGKLIIIHFKAKSNGESTIHFSRVELANRDAVIIPATLQDGKITTNPPLSPILTITKLNASDARLSWTSEGGIAEYHLYRGTTPYFEPQDPAYQTLSSTQYDDT
ncbi:MAG: cohesin domain-containing protein, partial [Candidatus Kryptoniota bacterium]